MTDRAPLRVLVVDDEPLGVARLVELLREQPDVELAGIAEDGQEAIDAIRTLRPDVVLLDVQMPNKSGLDVAFEIGPEEMPVTVFVTAYDRFALQAFDRAAIDYLVKPVDDSRFEEAFRRARKKLELEALDRLGMRMLRVARGELPGAPAELTAEPVAPAAAAPAAGYRERFAVTLRGRTLVLPVARVEYITASGSYAELHVGSEVHLLRESLQALEQQLDPKRFVRVHRSAIARLDLIDVLLRGSGGECWVQLKGGARLPVGRSRREALARRLAGE